MKVFVDRFPAGAAQGCCIVTNKSDIGQCGRVIRLDKELEDMPPVGALCISELGVRLLMEELGLKLLSLEEQEAHQHLVTTNAELRAELTELREALRNVLGAADLVGVEVSAPSLIYTELDEVVSA